MLVFEERGNRSTRRKPLGAEWRTNKLNPHMTPDLEIEPGPNWSEASALTTAPSLHPDAIPASQPVAVKGTQLHIVVSTTK